MDDLKPDNHPPDFGSLTGIMERFSQVPYEQFQKELNDWFYASLREKGIEQPLPQKDLPNLSTLISSIYHKAELSQLLSDLLIKERNGNG